MDEPDPEAPAEFTVSLGTDNNGGEIVIEVLREWAPLGVDRFYAALNDGFYDDSALFRVVPNFVVQFGIAGTPAENKKWQTEIKDDPVKTSNLAGTIVLGVSLLAGSWAAMFAVALLVFMMGVWLDQRVAVPFSESLRGTWTS